LTDKDHFIGKFLDKGPTNFTRMTLLHGVVIQSQIALHVRHIITSFMRNLRLLQWWSWRYGCYGMWRRVAGSFVPKVLQECSGLIFTFQAVLWCIWKVNLTCLYCGSCHVEIFICSIG